MIAAAPLIDVQNLSVRFGRQQVLRDVAISIPRGQTLAVIGESGCGKTVLLKTIIGLVSPTGGSVAFDGRQLDQLSDKELVELRTRFGFVFQNAALFDSMTIEENVLFPLRQHQRGHDAEHQRAMLGLLTEVGLPKSVLKKRPAELSGGMRKRVGLARALVMRPEAVLYDEPTTGLDPIMSDVINELMLRVRRSRPVTSIVVTHDMHSAQKVADRVVMLYPLARLQRTDSQVIFDGSTAELQKARDPRVGQFIRGEAGERLMEMREQSLHQT
jgi:phospholipid/cholesterol/gamma-HCH transport system ATP-binding protein